MKKLNIQPDFNPFSQMPEIGTVQQIDFPSGFEPHIRVEILDKHEQLDVIVTCRIKSTDDILRCVLTANALDGCKVYKNTRSLFIPFFPQARQDRVAVPGDAFGKEVINDLLLHYFNRVFAFDLHGKDPKEPRIFQSTSSMERKTTLSISPLHFINLVINAHGTPSNTVIVIPDTGALVKHDMIVKEGPLTPIAGLKTLVCTKHRDPSTGSLSIEIPVQNVKNKTCIIVDDICDGGGTFIPVAQSLKRQGAKKVVLAVSHGLFTKGIEHLIQGGIDHIFTTNSIKDWKHEKITIISDWPFLIGQK